MFRTIDDTVSVYGQLRPDDVTTAAELGFRTIVNNRPDGEEAGQPAAAEIEAAARAAGLAYVAIPVDHSGLSMPQVEAMAAVLAEQPGPVLAFCRSGTRSTNLWALARGLAGDEADQIVAKAANAGYDVSGLKPTLERLAGEG
jgi:uncharacterized protein (TIGR01244 family)